MARLSPTSLAKTSISLAPTALGGTGGVFLGMMLDDALGRMLAGKSEQVAMWAGFGVKALVAIMIIQLSRNETSLIRQAGAGAGSAMLGTATFQLFVHLGILSS